jgi:hypothetical protein
MKIETTLQIDKEFLSLIPPMLPSDYDRLEEDIFDNGCKEAIITWGNIIIDGFERYEICMKWGISFLIAKREFNNRHEAISWVCKRQLSDIDLLEETRRFLIGKYYEAEKELYMLRLSESGNSNHVHSCHYKIAARIGKEYNMSTSTVYKYGIYTRAIEDIAGKEADLASKILSGKLKISHNNIIELSRLPKENLRSLNSNLSEREIERISYSEVRHELQWKKLPSLPPAAKVEPQTDIPIKQIPKFDPDAELSSLALTVPSWSSSIKRTLQNSDLSLASLSAKQILKNKLQELQNSIEIMLSKIEEEI